MVSTTAASNGGGLHDQPGRERDRTDHDRRDDQGPALPEADQRDHSRQQGAGTGGRDGHAEQRPVGSEHDAGDRGVRRSHPGHGHRGLGLALRAGEDDGAGDQAGGHERRRDRRQQPALDQQRDRAEAEQQGGSDQGGTTPGGRLPRLEVALDDVGHRLDDVVVDPRRLVVDAGGDGQHDPVLDALHGEAGVGGELTALLRHQPVAAVDGRAVEQPDAPGQLGQQLGHRHRGRQHQVDPSRPRGDRDLHQPGGAGGCLTHEAFSPDPVVDPIRTPRMLPAGRGAGPAGSHEGGQLMTPGAASSSSTQSWSSMIASTWAPLSSLDLRPPRPPAPPAAPRPEPRPPDFDPLVPRPPAAAPAPAPRAAALRPAVEPAVEPRPSAPAGSGAAAAADRPGGAGDA